VSLEAIQFRVATRQDTLALIDLKWAINLAEHAVYPKNSGIPEILDLSRDAAKSGMEEYWSVIETNGGAFLVGLREGEIVCAGCWYGEAAAVSTLPQFQRQAGIGCIIVLPIARGMGLGREIMIRLEAMIRAEGITHVRLTVVPGNLPAETLYSQLGYKPFETVMIKAIG
jgi:GNAT superfamily N-acetyltransferase